MGHKRFFVAQQGYFGFVPQDIELEDAVCVLFGVDMQFIFACIAELYQWYISPLHSLTRKGYEVPW